MLLTENDKRWANIITEEYHVENPQKVEWMSKMAQIHELKESLQTGAVSGGIYSTPLNTLGMGNPMAPQQGNIPGFTQGTQGAGYGNTGADFHSPNYQVGSGDIPMSTLPMALEIAAMTIGFELVPVIPATGPWCMLTYGDVVYAGGKLGRLNETSLDGKGAEKENKPIYIKFPSALTTKATTGDIVVVGKDTETTPGTLDVALDTTKPYFFGVVIGYSRIDNSLITKVIGIGTGTVDKNGPHTDNTNTSIADVFGTANFIGEYDAYDKDSTSAATLSANKANFTTPVHPELVASAADHIQGFSNFFDGSDDPMTRAQNETGVGETMGFRTFSKWVKMGSYEVTGSVTRQQLQDMPLYGVDVIGQVLEYMQNEISQAINNRILDRVFKLGVENYKIQRQYQGVDLNLWLAGSGNAKYVKDFAAAKYYKDINGATIGTNWGTTYGVYNGTFTTTYENTMTYQRRIASRVLYAKNLIANVSRRGYADWMVTNFAVISALQDIKGFVIAPTTNTLTQDNSGSLYFAGTLNGLAVYCDPYMTADDMRICVGRKSDGKTPGVIFMPYILADTVQTIVEGTMAPKLLVNSRFAIVDAGFHPEQNYYTFMLDTNENPQGYTEPTDIASMARFI